MEGGRRGEEVRKGAGGGRGKVRKGRGGGREKGEEVR